MKIILGTLFFWVIITFTILLIVFWLASYFKIPTTPKNHPHDAIQYAAVLALFSAFSALSFFLVVLLYDSVSIFKPLDSSGFTFTLIIAGTGWAILILHWLFFKFLDYITKYQSPSYKLTDIEISWTWIFIFIALSITCFRFDLPTQAFTFAGLIFAYFVWIGTSLTSVKNKLLEIKELSLLYWYIISCIGILCIILAECATPPYNLLPIAGMIFGVFSNIIVVKYFFKTP